MNTCLTSLLLVYLDKVSIGIYVQYESIWYIMACIYTIRFTFSLNKMAPNILPAANDFILLRGFHFSEWHILKGAILVMVTLCPPLSFINYHFSHLRGEIIWLNEIPFTTKINIRRVWQRWYRLIQRSVKADAILIS